MVTEPPEIPVITPEGDMTAIAVLLDDQLPPVVASVNVAVNPWHTSVGPAIAAGNGFMVTVVVLKHPAGVVYVITEVPPDIPVTTPVAAPTDAMVALVLLHVPPPIEPDKFVVLPTHADKVPVMLGNPFTTTVAIAEQPEEVIV
jgi:hypothetical protein